MIPESKGPRPLDPVTRLLLHLIRDRRDREELSTDLEELRLRGRHTRLWLWREVVRTAWGTRDGGAGSPRHLVESVMGDLRFSLRVLLRSPALLLVAIPTMALALGATTAIFGFADALLLRPLPVREPHRLVALWHVSTEGRLAYSQFSVPDYVGLREQSHDAVAAWQNVAIRVGDRLDEPPVSGLLVSGNYFDVMGVRLAAGRGFVPEEDETPGTHDVVVVSRGLAERAFGSVADAVGGTLLLEGTPFTVVGVAPADTPTLDTESTPDFWAPLMTYPILLHGWRYDLFTNRGTHNLSVFVRLRDGVQVAAAQSEFEALARRQAELNPDTNRGWSIVLVDAAASRLGPPGSQPLRNVTALLAGVVAMVLLIASANVANILLAKGAARAQEMGVRFSIGASRSRLVRQTLTESLVLAALGGGLGVLLAAGTPRLLTHLALGVGLTGMDIRLDARVVGFAAAMTLGTGVVFGLFPALRASSTEAARGARSPSASVGHQGMRQSLVVAQVALAFVLLVGAGLTIRTLSALENLPMGFSTRDLLVARLDLGQTPEPAESDPATWDRVLNALRDVSGVRQGCLGFTSPFSASRLANDVYFESGDSAGGRGLLNVDENIVDPEYFQTLGIRVVAGRTFTSEDGAADAGSVVVNEALAARLWPGENPLGKRMWDRGWNGEPDRPLEVVGVVADGRYYRSWRNVNRPFVFLPLAQAPQREMSVILRSAGSGAADVARVRAALAGAIPTLPPPNVVAVDVVRDEALGLQRTNARLLALFGGLATLVALIGVYGVVSFTVARRTHEIGVRLALGASPTDVRRMILVGSSKPLLAGGALGVGIAALVVRFLSPLLYGVSPWDPATWGAVLAGILATGLLASHLPARRATRVDPVLVLKD